MNTVVVHCNAMLPLQNDADSFTLETPNDAHFPKEYYITINEDNAETQKAVDAICSAKETVNIDVSDVGTRQKFELKHSQAFAYKSCCLCVDGDPMAFLTCSCAMGRILVTQKNTGHQSLKTLDECDREDDYYFGGIVQNWYATAWSSASFIVALHGRCRVLTKNDNSATANKSIVFSNNVGLHAQKYAREEPCCNTGMLCGNSVLQNCWHVRLGKHA